MKRSIKNRIAAALLLASSLGGHNYKTGAVDHVDSRKLKNNKQSASFPLLAKIGIPVGLVSVLGLGYHHLNKPKYMFEQDKYKLSKKDREKYELIHNKNFEFMTRSVKNDKQKDLVEAFKKIAEKLKGLTYAAAEEKLFTKIKKFTTPTGHFVSNKPVVEWCSADESGDGIEELSDLNYHTFEKNEILKSPEMIQKNLKRRNGNEIGVMSSDKINLWRVIYISQGSKVNEYQLFLDTMLGFYRAIENRIKDGNLKFEMCDNSIVIEEIQREGIKMVCSLDFDQGLLSIKNEMIYKLDSGKAQVGYTESVFDVSEWI